MVFFFKLISFFINFLIWLLKKNLNADVALKKYQIIFLNNILMATSASRAFHLPRRRFPLVS